MAYELRCTVCHDVFKANTPTSIKHLTAAARAAGWSQSKGKWVCNWHARAFEADGGHVLAGLIDRYGLPRPRREFPFLGYKLDFYYPSERLAIEVEGGIWLPGGGGRHQRAAGYQRDVAKYNLLTLNNIVLLRYTPDMLADDPSKVIEEIERMLAMQKGYAHAQSED